MAKVRVLQPLRKIVGGSELVEVGATTVSGVIEYLDSHHPGFRAKLFSGDNEVKEFINIFVDGEDIRFLDGLNTTVSEQAEVLIVPAVAGG